MAYVPPSTWLNSASKWLQDPGNQNLLAGIGAKLDPQGVGGALGGATIAYNQSRVAEQRAAAQEKVNEEQRQSALKLYGLTPPGTPGPTKIEAKKDGNIIQTSDVGTSNVAAPAASTQAPGSGVLLPQVEVPPVTAAPLATGTGTSAVPLTMPATTVTAQREPAAAAAPANPYATTADMRQFDVRQIAPFS